MLTPSCFSQTERLTSLCNVETKTPHGGAELLPSHLKGGDVKINRMLSKSITLKVVYSLVPL